MKTEKSMKTAVNYDSSRIEIALSNKEVVLGAILKNLSKT